MGISRVGLILWVIIYDVMILEWEWRLEGKVISSF